MEEQDTASSSVDINKSDSNIITVTFQFFRKNDRCVIIPIMNGKEIDSTSFKLFITFGRILFEIPDRLTGRISIYDGHDYNTTTDDGSESSHLPDFVTFANQNEEVTEKYLVLTILQIEEIFRRLEVFYDELNHAYIFIRDFSYKDQLVIQQLRINYWYFFQDTNRIIRRI